MDRAETVDFDYVDVYLVLTTKREIPSCFEGHKIQETNRNNLETKKVRDPKIHG